MTNCVHVKSYIADTRIHQINRDDGGVEFIYVAYDDQGHPYYTVMHPERRGLANMHCAPSVVEAVEWYRSQLVEAAVAI